MTAKAPTPCTICHTLGPCPHRGQARTTRATWAWAQHSRSLIAHHVATFGWWCPGLGNHQAHDVDPGNLTAHHIDELATTGTDTGHHVVLCRSENSRLGAIR